MTHVRRSGLTLVEVLVAVVILQSGMLAALSLSTLAARVAQRAARTEQVVSALAGVADSLTLLDSMADGRARYHDVDVVWVAVGPYAELRGTLDGADTVDLTIRLAGVLGGR